LYNVGEIDNSYQSISFGPFPSAEKGQANWKVPNYNDGSFKELRTNDEDEILSQKPFDEQEEDEDDDDSPEKETPSNYQVVSFGENPQQPLLLNPEENSVQAPEDDDVTEVVTEKPIPVVSQVVSFEESPQQAGIEEEMIKHNMKVKKAVNQEATAFEDTPQENMLDKVNEMVEKVTPPSSYQMVSFGENPELLLVQEDIFQNKKVKKSTLQQQTQLSSPSFEGKNDLFDKVNKMVEKEKPTSYQVVSFGENPQLSVIHGENKKAPKSSQQELQPISDPSFDGEEDMFDKINKMVEKEKPSSYQVVSFGETPQLSVIHGENKKAPKSSQQELQQLSDPSFDGEEDMFDKINKMVENEQPTSYQVVSFGENPQLSVEHGDLLKGEKKVKKSVPKQQQQQQHLSTSSFDNEEDVFEKINKMVHNENPSSYQFVTLGQHLEVETDRMKKSTIFENSKFDANPIVDNEDMFGKMHGMMEKLKTPPSSYQFVNFGDVSQQVLIFLITPSKS